MSRSLQEVIDALARAGILIDAPKPAAGALPEITGLTADARRLTPGMLFCAVRGAVLDGHAFVGDAAARGAAAALVESRQSVAIPQILVRNGRRAAAIAAEAWYRRRVRSTCRRRSPRWSIAVPAVSPWKCRRTASIRGASKG